MHLVTRETFSKKKAVQQEAFASGDSPALPSQMLQGRITLLYKGKGVDRASPASYRPVSLLNTDYKMAARALASGMRPALNSVVTAHQTCNLPYAQLCGGILCLAERGVPRHQWRMTRL